MAWIETCEDLGPESRWIMDRHLNRLVSLQNDLAAAELRLRKVTKSDPIVAKLLRLPGVGPVTAWALRAEIGRFDRFRTGKQLARFCGLTPRNASSGSRQADAGLIKAANPTLRALLIQAAHRLARTNERWSILAQTMRRAGKPENVIKAAIANRWMRWVFHQMQPERLAA